VREQRGSASLIVATTIGLAAILSALSADLAHVAVARTRAQTAADAAALAAAQELIVPSAKTPAEVAEDYAGRHSAEVTECRCSADANEVIVAVQIEVALPFLGGERRVGAEARAVVEPLEMAGLEPAFASRLRCLFAIVPGLSIVSGFRTHAEQAALYEEKPDLAAPPGHSMHELGLAADLGFPSEFARDLAHASAGSCGLEFPVSYEPWHIEPIGVVHA
jgi:secretion/DNA translocation related TadE-like protein